MASDAHFVDSIRAQLDGVPALPSLAGGAKIPNQETLAAMQRSRKGLETPYQNADALFQALNAAVESKY